MTTTNPTPFNPKDLLTPAEVARMFKVDAKTVSIWEANGKLDSVRTPGGTRRYSRLQCEAIRNGGAR